MICDLVLKGVKYVLTKVDEKISVKEELELTGVA